MRISCGGVWGVCGGISNSNWFLFLLFLARGPRPAENGKLKASSELRARSSEPGALLASGVDVDVDVDVDGRGRGLVAHGLP
jgi:hypothetical protein